MLDAGCWMLDAECWMLGARCWMLGAGCWMLGAGCCSRNALLVLRTENVSGDLDEKALVTLKRMTGHKLPQ